MRRLVRPRLCPRGTTRPAAPKHKTQAETAKTCARSACTEQHGIFRRSNKRLPIRGTDCAHPVDACGRVVGLASGVALRVAEIKQRAMGDADLIALAMRR